MASEPPDEYAVINGLMYQKTNGALSAIPHPITTEDQAKIDAVWAAYDEAGQPFMFYRRVG